MTDSDTYDLKPSKQAYQAVKSDVTPVSAFKELVDNALDNWRRVLDGLDPLTIEIEYHDGGPDSKDEIVIRDDSGGVEEDDLNMLFALGQSKKQVIDGSIGAYGVGAKKAIVNLGNKATIRSQHMYADTGFGFTIGQDWLEDEDDWTVDKEQYDDLDAGVTEIRITDLNIAWENYRDNLVEDLGQTYQFYLGSDRLDELDPVSVVVRECNADGDVVDSEEVRPPEAIDWSFAPIDGYYVRRYEGIELESKEFESTVTLNVTVGLMREANAEHAGADIFCQNRQVIKAVTDERAGFGMGSLGKFSGQHRRLRVIIEFETDGDASVLPWDAQKSDIDPYTRVSRAARDWIGRIVQPYYRAAGAYDEFPTSLTRPYGRGDDHAETKGLDDPYDYTGRKRVTHKPDKDFEDAHSITDRADATAPLGVYSPGDLPEKFVPAYREELLRLLNNNFDIKIDDEETLPTEEIPAAEVPADLEASDAERIRSDLQQRARDDAGGISPQRTVGLPEWQQPLYDRLLRQEVGEDAEFDDLETVEYEEDEALDVTDDSDAGEEDSEGDVPDDEADGESEEDSETDSDDGFDEVDLGGDSGEEDGDTSDTATEIGGVGGAQPAGGRYALELTEEEWETLVEALGVEEDAPPEEVRDQLLDKMSVLRQLTA